MQNTLLSLKSELTQIEEEVAEAARHGDLRENRAFEIATQSRDLKRHQIEQMQLVLDDCVVDNTVGVKKFNKVELMTKVTIIEMGVNRQEVIYIVIDTLGNVGNVDFSGDQLTPDKVSNETHFGRTLINKPIDSIITYSGKRYKILAVDPINYSEFFET